MAKIKVKEKGNSKPTAIVKSGSRLKNFLKDTQNETKKVTWPDKKHVVNATIFILIIVFVLTCFIMTMDMIFTKAIVYLRGINI